MEAQRDRRTGGGEEQRKREIVQNIYVTDTSQRGKNQKETIF